jgi:hypothetical protein
MKNQVPAGRPGKNERRNPQQYIESSNKSRWRKFVAIDYFPSGNVGPIQKEGAAICETISGTIPNCGASQTSPSAFGGRFGALYRFPGIELGPSLGYLYGGPTAGTSNISENGEGPGSASLKSTDNTVRLLLEAKHQFDLSGPWSFAVGAGVGGALVNESDTCSVAGSGSSLCGAAPNGSTMFWLTWELSPSILYKSWELGLRYAGFSKSGQLAWNTFGLFAGYNF